MMKQLLYALAMSGIITANILALYLIYLSFYPIKIVELTAPPVVEEAVVNPGDEVHIRMEFTKLRDYRSEIIWSLVNGEVYQIESGRTIRKPGEHVVLRTIDIPKIAHADTYHVEIDIEYTITPWRKINYKWLTNTFEVIDDKAL